MTKAAKRKNIMKDDKADDIPFAGVDPVTAGDSDRASAAENPMSMNSTESDGSGERSGMKGSNEGGSFESDGCDSGSEDLPSSVGSHDDGSRWSNGGPFLSTSTGSDQNHRESPMSSDMAHKSERLVIRDIDVENFKSYYGRHRIGPFHKTFTAVIGPNGSGKSNVIDSMLFVFGRNAKKIRLEKLSELIHSSAAHPDLTYASVTVNFIRVSKVSESDIKDAEQRAEVPGSALSIKREVFRSGISQYFIDGSRRTQKEVVERLIAEGVDLEHNRFLILQGEVEQIALMKPKAEREGEEGLLEYLDDLIGTSEFIERISVASRLAEAAQLSRLESLDKERKLLAEREALDDAKNSTMAFVTKDNHLQKTLIVMCQLRMRGIDERLVEPRRLLGEIDTRIASYEDEVKVRREEKAQAEEAAVRTKKEVAEAAKERDRARGKRQTVEAQLEKLKSGANEEERARKKVVDQQKKAKEEMQRATLLQQDAEREGAIHQQHHDESVTESARLQAEFDTMSEELLPKLRPLRQALEEKKRDFAPYERAVTEAREALSTCRSRIDGLDASVTRKIQETQDLELSMDTQRTRAREVGEMLARADNRDHQEEARRLIDAAAAAAQRKFAINNTIQEAKASFREGEADDRAMEFLLSQRTLKGYYGTLRQLGRIDDTYDIAAGVASNAWGFHVVEDRATAAAALELLKKHNIGRATMMVVNEIEKEMGPRCRKPFAAPNPKARRIFDLIKPTNEKFNCVFYQAVRDTLVVPTLAEARETAFGGGERHRVVSLRGELVEPTGTITGGGANPRGAKLKAARSPQDKAAVKEELQRLQQELIQAAEEERVAQQRLHALQEKELRLSPEQVRKLRGEQSKLTVSIDSDEQRRNVLRAEVEQLQREAVKRRASLAGQLETCEEALTAALGESGERQADMVRLEAAMSEAGGAAFTRVTEALKQSQARTEAEEDALRGCRKNSQKARAVMERKAKDLADYAATLARMEAEAAEGVREQIAECTAAIEELTRQLNGTEASLAQAQGRADAARSAVPLANSAVVTAQKLLDDEQRYRQTEQAKIADALQELAKFEQKIEACEEKIKENAELYGVETLQLEARASEDGAAEDAANGGKRAGACHSDNDDDDGDEDEDEDGGEDDDITPTKSGGGDKEIDCAQRKKRKPYAGRKRGRDSDGSATSNNKAAVDVRAMSFRISTEELDCCDYERSVHLAKALSEETKRLHGEIDFRAVALWRERDVAHRRAKALYLERKVVSDTLEAELGTLKERRRAAFMAVFDIIRRKLKEVYQLLTHGGDADMELVDVNDPFEGINFVVRPPKKSWKQISNLSGGEKTLSSLALIFSLHHVKPTPIYVMDEIDAALDFRNVSIVANYVLRQTTGAQFIIISLRNNMFEMAHQLVGVCKVNDVTSTLVLRPRHFQKAVEERLRSLHAPRRVGGEEGPSSTPPSLAGQLNGNVSGHHNRGSMALPQCGKPSMGEPGSAGARPSRKSVRFSDQIMDPEKENDAPVC